jgi:hypothetical protein
MDEFEMGVWGKRGGIMGGKATQSLPLPTRLLQVFKDS